MFMAFTTGLCSSVELFFCFTCIHIVSCDLIYHLLQEPIYIDNRYMTKFRPNRRKFSLGIKRNDGIRRVSDARKLLAKELEYSVLCSVELWSYLWPPKQVLFEIFVSDLFFERFAICLQVLLSFFCYRVGFSCSSFLLLSLACEESFLL